MKTLLILLSVITLISCSKEAEKLTNTDPSVEVTFGPIYAGSNASVKFNVTFYNTESVTRVNLYRSVSILVAYENYPEPKSYVLYDHMIADYPHYSNHIWYEFEFVMNDGTRIRSEPFQVY